MSNWVDFGLDVLAASPEEINQIEASLQEPCDELLCWVAGLVDKRQEEISADVKGLVSFKPDRNLGYIAPSVNKARRSKNFFKDRGWGTVMSHVVLVSAKFPAAVFLLEYWDDQYSYAGKTVIRGGQEIREVRDGNQQSQSCEWVLPNIFAPYRAEYDRELEFGSLWNQWVSELADAVKELRSSAPLWQRRPISPEQQVQTIASIVKRYLESLPSEAIEKANPKLLDMLDLPVEDDAKKPVN